MEMSKIIQIHDVRKSIAKERLLLHGRARAADSFISNRDLHEDNKQAARGKRLSFTFDEPSDAPPSCNHDLEYPSGHSAIAHKNS